MTAMSRRRLIHLATAATATSVLAACSSGTAARSQSSSSAGASAPAGSAGLTIGMSYTPNVQFAPFYMAQAGEQYAAGVTLRHHGAQEGLFDALAAGTEQLVVAGADEAVVAASGGSDLVVVGGYYQAYPGCVIVPEDSEIRSLADLAGRTIGLPGRFGENWFAFQVAMESAGLSESDLQVQEIGYTQQAALVGGKVDAIVGFSNNDAVQITLAGTPVRTLAVAEQVPLVGASLVTTNAVLEQRREELAAVVAASAAGMEAFAADPDAAVEATKAYVTDLVDATQAANARAVAVATAELIEPAGSTAAVGSLSTEQVEAMIAFLDDHGLLTGAAPTVEAVCDPLV
ncbi:ABC transporter substrate-binding protein [Actinomyces urogenitalis]|uniref:ABC transporter substrate-binding protein n=1 Tax=Actinomyces urogenitalis TaxID=103621 RepID=UPI00050EE2BE|nr:ABC transporter substrate-binding protein [Actinomyces urogenitalis]KGF03774.1 myristoyl transferase [Actinomyces urogenitalis S6-C4]MBS5976115.1 ABC transporter substrate-binding protein [Actinomyces urogenitalis]MBS6071504.1 ABC transporter substrate-binding protein [Actinomyces urogenitalis]MDU0863332.1 ABC transporter substrate-binding protein [Actinomyces urogenitalis]MDU0873893.1 ABC transporter substrate-binding protein [Actinomyces urogenitalis]